MKEPLRCLICNRIGRHIDCDNLIRDAALLATTIRRTLWWRISMQRGGPSIR